MKHPPVLRINFCADWRLAIVVVATILLVLHAAQAFAGSAKGTAQIGFFGQPQQGFQHVYLNITGVRLSPKKNPGPSDPKWQLVPAPSQAGATQGGSDAELQLDLNSVQNVPVLFNGASVRKDTYQTAELLLDSANPGSIVTNCPQAGSNEGCIIYPITLFNSGNQILTPEGSLVMSVADHKTSWQILQISLQVVQPPAVSGAPYVVNVSILPLSNSTVLPTGQFLSAVTGSVESQPTPTTTPTPVAVAPGPETATAMPQAAATATPTPRNRVLSVTAEVGGTDTVVTTDGVQSNNGYTLQLPVAGTFGSYYDLYVSGGTSNYQAVRLPMLTGNSYTQNFKTNTNKTLSTISGTVVDACTGKPIIGAIAELLIAPLNNPTADCSSTPEACVVVASGSTDDLGHFPLPGTFKIPAALDRVPQPQKDFPYTLMVSASGYDTLIRSPVLPDSAAKGVNCGTSSKFQSCDLSLTSGFISGMIQVSGPTSGSDILAQVFAEQAGTGTLVSTLSTPLILKSSFNYTKAYTLRVPTQSGNLDLIATTIDLYQGAADPYSGHTIEVLPNIAPPPLEPSPQCNAPVTVPDFPELTCVGHGSIVGTVINPDLGASVVLSKNGVQLATTPLQNVNPVLPFPPSNSYSFCAPADTYTLQRYELPTPTASVAPTIVPTPVPDGNQVSVTIPTPQLVATPTAHASPTPTNEPPPCPTICTNPGGSCPGVCASANPNPL
ncbi:MAG TPA: hypothetical protein VMU16_06540 [Candidatus Binataceae bacterium]|nr:hypothetical protein [Candidatus Binataceae bacterium]